MPDRARRILAYFSREGKGPKPIGKVDQHSSRNVIRNKPTTLEPEDESKTLVVSKAATQVTAAKGRDTVSRTALTGLWDEAYKLIEEKDADFLTTYERYLLLAQESGELGMYCVSGFHSPLILNLLLQNQPQSCP
jgi:hypothetical protein